MRHLLYALIFATSFISLPAVAKILCSTNGHHQTAAVEVIRDLASNGQLWSEINNLLAQNNQRDQRFAEVVKSRIERELIANLQIDEAASYFRSIFYVGREFTFELDCLGRWSLDLATPRNG